MAKSGSQNSHFWPQWMGGRRGQSQRGDYGNRLRWRWLDSVTWVWRRSHGYEDGRTLSYQYVVPEEQKNGGTFYINGVEYDLKNNGSVFLVQSLKDNKLTQVNGLDLSHLVIDSETLSIASVTEFCMANQQILDFFDSGINADESNNWIDVCTCTTSFNALTTPSSALSVVSVVVDSSRSTEKSLTTNPFHGLRILLEWSSTAFSCTSQ